MSAAVDIVDTTTVTNYVMWFRQNSYLLVSLPTSAVELGQHLSLQL